MGKTKIKEYRGEAVHRERMHRAGPALYEALRAVKRGTIDTQTADKSANVHVLRHSAWEQVCATLALVDGEVQP